jgi:hypothetical protein
VCHLAGAAAATWAGCQRGPWGMGGGAGGAAARWPFTDKGQDVNFRFKFRLIIQRPNNSGCCRLQTRLVCEPLPKKLTDRLWSLELSFSGQRNGDCCWQAKAQTQNSREQNPENFSAFPKSRGVREETLEVSIFAFCSAT